MLRRWAANHSDTVSPHAGRWLWWDAARVGPRQLLRRIEFNVRNGAPPLRLAVGRHDRVGLEVRQGIGTVRRGIGTVRQGIGIVSLWDLISGGQLVQVA